MPLSFKHITTSLSIFAVLLALSGCNIGKKSTPPSFYVLSANSEQIVQAEKAQGGQFAVGVSKANIPSFLDRRQIVSYNNHNLLDYAEFHRWGEPLDESITRTIRENLSIALSTDHVFAHPWSRSMVRDYELYTTITEFAYNKQMQQIKLKIVWRITSAQDKVTFNIKESEYTQDALDQPNYEDIVHLMSELLSEFCNDAAKTISELEGVHAAAAAQVQ